MVELDWPLLWPTLCQLGKPDFPPERRQSSNDPLEVMELQKLDVLSVVLLCSSVLFDTL